MNANDVLRFLLRNPAFFEEHPALVTQLRLPHPHSGKAISLTERQLIGLRQRIAQLEDKFGALLECGEENDAIGDKMHRLSVGLLEATDFPTARQALYTHLLEDFVVPHVAFRVWCSAHSYPGAEFMLVGEEVRQFTIDLPEPYCGTPPLAEITQWFGPEGQQVRSQALVPLHYAGEILGLLAMGSEDPERFYSGMGTLYLTRLGELISASLHRHLG